MTSPKSQAFLAVAGGLLNRGHRVRFRAEGDSMHPTIRGGEAILVEPVSLAHVKRGDIVFYLSERGITAHRVVRIESRGEQAPVFLTRGDASGSADEPVEQEQILGKVVAVERAGRSIDLDNRIEKMKRVVRICASRIARRVIVPRGSWVSSPTCDLRPISSLKSQVKSG